MAKKTSRSAALKAKKVVTIALTKKRETSQSVKGLAIRIDGFRCKFNSCSFLATNNRLIADHAKEQHPKKRASKAKKPAQVVPANGCGDCPRVFHNSRQLKFHVKSSHSGKVKKAFNFRIPGYMKVTCAAKPTKSSAVVTDPAAIAEYKCSICGDKFGTPLMLTGHIKNVHELLRPKPMSRICQQKFVKFALNAGAKLSCAKKLF